MSRAPSWSRLARGARGSAARARRRAHSARALRLGLRALQLGTLALLLAALPASRAWAQAPAEAGPVDPATARAELRFAADTLLAVHPALVTPAAREALEAELADDQARLGGAPTADDVAVALQLLLASVRDAHTTGAPQATSRRYLPLGFVVVSDGVLVAPVGGVDVGLPGAGRLVRLGNLTPEDLLARMRELVSGTDAWVGYRLGQLVNAEAVLRFLGVVDEGEGDAPQRASVRVTVEDPDGGEVTARVPLVPVAELAQAASPLQALLQRAVGVAEEWQGRGPSWLWRIDAASGTGVFWLLSCVDSPEYRAAVDDFFRAVAAAGARRVVIDLRFDGGGNSGVATALLRHLPARVVRGYGETLRPSDEVASQRGTDADALARAASAGRHPRRHGNGKNMRVRRRYAG